MKFKTKYFLIIGICAILIAVCFGFNVAPTVSYFSSTNKSYYLFQMGDISLEYYDDGNKIYANDFEISKDFGVNTVQTSQLKIKNVAKTYCYIRFKICYTIDGEVYDEGIAVNNSTSYHTTSVENGKFSSGCWVKDVDGWYYFKENTTSEKYAQFSKGSTITTFENFKIDYENLKLSSWKTVHVYVLIHASIVNTFK